MPVARELLSRMPYRQKGPDKRHVQYARKVHGDVKTLSAYSLNEKVQLHMPWNLLSDLTFRWPPPNKVLHMFLSPALRQEEWSCALRKPLRGIHSSKRSCSRSARIPAPPHFLGSHARCQWSTNLPAPPPPGRRGQKPRSIVSSATCGMITQTSRAYAEKPTAPDAAIVWSWG